MTGALFPNDKGDNPKRPDWRGDITINGVKYRVSGWIRAGKRGDFISMKADLPLPTEGEASAARSAHAQRSAAPATSRRDMDDEIPF